MKIEKLHVVKCILFSFAFIFFQTTETKGTVLITNADELINFSKSEEESMEKIVKPLAESGVTCVVSGGKIGELALHMLDKYQVRTFIKLFLLFTVYF